MWDCVGSGGALWHHKQQCWLTNQFSDVRVVKLLHTCSLSQELLNVSRGEDVRWKKVTVSFPPLWVAPRDFIRSLFFVAQHILSDLQLDEPVYNKAEPDTFSWDERQ